MWTYQWGLSILVSINVYKWGWRKKKLQSGETTHCFITELLLIYSYTNNNVSSAKTNICLRFTHCTLIFIYLTWIQCEPLFKSLLMIFFLLSLILSSRVMTGNFVSFWSSFEHLFALKAAAAWHFKCHQLCINIAIFATLFHKCATLFDND